MLISLMASIKATPGWLQAEAAGGPSAAEQQAAQAAVEKVKALLADDNPEALTVWEAHSGALRAMFANAGQIKDAIAAYDFEGTLELLKQAAVADRTGTSSP